MFTHGIFGRRNVCGALNGPLRQRALPFRAYDMPEANLTQNLSRPPYYPWNSAVNSER